MTEDNSIKTVDTIKLELEPTIKEEETSKDAKHLVYNEKDFPSLK